MIFIPATDAPDAKVRPRRENTIYVYEVPVRLWHWINALSIVVLAVTGYLIGSPPPSVPGEASASFLFGNIRFVHFAAGYVFAVGFVSRVIWAFFGNRYSRQIFYLPLTSKTWWSEVLFELKWYLFLTPEPKKYVGHNPMAHLMMFFFITVASIFMICTGFAMYSEGTGMDSWQHTMFGWVINFAVNTQNLHTWHHMTAWAIVIFVILHVYAAVREDIMSRQTMISTMISGERMFKDDKP